MRHLAEAFFELLQSGDRSRSSAPCRGIRLAEPPGGDQDLLATDTFEEGLGFKENPQEGNTTYNFSKEVTTVYVQSMGLALSQMGFRINAVLPGPVETPILVDFEESMG